MRVRRGWWEREGQGLEGKEGVGDGDGKDKALTLRRGWWTVGWEGQGLEGMDGTEGLEGQGLEGKEVDGHETFL